MHKKILRPINRASVEAQTVDGFFIDKIMSNGWIKIHRKILEWEWYDDSNTFKLFIHLLLKANHKEKQYRGIKIKKGQIMTGLQLLSEQMNISIRKIRTSLGKLKATNEVTIKTSSQGSIIQIVNYSSYQLATSDLTNERQASDKRATSNKNEENEEKNIPTFFVFKEYAISKKPNVDLEALGLKYDSWVENSWANGNGKKIKNWKTSLLNTLPYIKEKPNARMKIK